MTGADLEQGDVFLGCPVYRVESPLNGGASGELEVIEERHDVVILTQTCDLINDKVEDVLVAAVLSYDEICRASGPAQGHVRSTAFRKAAVAGTLPAYSLLQNRDEEPRLGWSLVSFHHLFTLPKVALVGAAQHQGERLRLIPPYKEHLAQAFARYMMRVGLPTTLGDFERLAPPPVS